MKIWIDLDNSPAALMFSPIARRLGERGHEVVVTARDNAQTVELGRAVWPDLTVIGGPSPPGRLPKVGATLARIRDLRSWAAQRRPDVALSHNSYPQLLAARALRLPVVTATDYEHHPANRVAFRAATILLLPEAMREVDVRRLGARPSKTRFYPGLKEEIYLGDFEPDPAALEKIGVMREPRTAVVLARTPPDRAIYHQFGNPLFTEAMQAIGREPHARAVVLTRYPEQRPAIARLGLPNIVVPDKAVDSRSLIRAADVVIGAGGTMTREAAVLGAKTYSLYAGASPAVDRWLERAGRLTRLQRAEQLLPVRPVDTPPLDLQALRARGAELVEWFVRAIEDVAD